MNQAIRTLIVDDEPHARHGLRFLLSGEPDIEILGETSGRDAVGAIGALTPDLVFMDVEMPGCDGLAVARQVDPAALSALVFVSGAPKYAAQAYDLGAIDYLLKPFSDERFKRALHRARQSLGRDTKAPAYLTRFTVKSGTGHRLCHVDDIDWIEADDYYCRIHVAGETHLVREVLGFFEDRLPPERFVRVHRSAIVNLDRVIEIEPLFKGDCNVKLRDGTRVRMSRRRREGLSDRLYAFA